MKKEELHSIAPILADLKFKPEAFKMPQNGLDEVEKAVLSTLYSQKLKDITGSANPFKVHTTYFNEVEDKVFDKLSSSNKIKNNLKVPENYFENLEQQVLNKLKSKSLEQQTKVISLRSSIIKISATVAVAASLALLFILNPFNKTEHITFDSLAISDIESWIENDRLELDAYQIAAVYNEVKLTPKVISTSIDETELESFLRNQDIEVLLYEE